MKKTLLTTALVGLSISPVFSQKMQKNTEKTAKEIHTNVLDTVNTSLSNQYQQALKKSLEPMTFSPWKHMPWHVIIHLPCWDADKENLLHMLQNLLGSTYNLRDLHSSKDYLLQVDPAQTQSIRDLLAQWGISAVFDEMLSNEWDGVILPDDPGVQSCDSDLLWSAESVDLDSLRAVTKVSMRNGQDDPDENVKLVYNEFADPLYNGTEIPLTDSVNSYNEYLWNTNFSSPLGAHGSVVVPTWSSLTNNSYGMSWTWWQVWRIVYRNTYSWTWYNTSSYVAELNWAISYLNSNPTKWLILSKSHAAWWSLTPGLVAADSTLDALNRCIMVNSAWNANVTTNEREEAQNFPRFLSVGGSDGSWSKRSSSDYGSRVDVYRKWSWNNWLALWWTWLVIW
jgi:hypothetical protein